MADEKQTIDSLAFSATANGIFEAATDVNSGRDALLQAYQSANWTDPKSAEDDLQYYGQALKYKLQDQSPFTADVIESESPIPMYSSLLPALEGESDKDYVSRWEAANLKYLDSQNTPEFVVAKDQWKNDIKEYASDKRRVLNAKQADKATDLPFPLKQIGEFNQGAGDLLKRAARGALSIVEPIVNALSLAITPDYELNSHLTEYIDPRNDGKLLSQLAEGAGSAAGSIAAFAVNPAVGVAAIGIQATDAVATRYRDTLRRTGDEEKANKARLIEAGSQVIQAAGEKLIFGKLGKIVRGAEQAAEPVAESAVKTITKSAVGEGVTEGTGQFISNFAEDIERNKDTPTSEKLSQAARAGAIGFVVGGGAAAATTGYSNSRAANVAKANTNQRGTEIAEFGYPVTPVTKQVVGELVPGVDTQNIAAPADVDVDVVPLNSPEQLAPQETSSSDDVANIPAVPAFETSDGQRFLKTEDGFFVTEKDGVRSNPHDQMAFIDESNAQKVAQAISTGENVILGEKGSVAIERVEPGKLPTYEEIPTSDTPVEGMYALPISRERSPNAQTKERLIDVPRKISTVNTPVEAKSAGAAAIGQFGAEESTYSRKIAQNPLMQQALKDATGFDKLYPSAGRDSFAAMDSRVQAYVEANGVEGAVKLVQGGDPASEAADPTLRIRMTGFLHNLVASEQASGDPARVELANNLITNIAQDISDVRTTAGQVLVAGKGLVPVESLQRQAKSYTDAYESEAAKVGSEEGATVEEVKQAPKLVEDAAKAVEAATVELQQEEKAVGKPVTTEETIAEDQAIADIEAQASEKLSEDIGAIEQESADLVEEIAVTEKKAARQKRKDVAAVEEAIATDGEKLVQAVNDSIDLTDITTEEQTKLDTTIREALKNAEEKANAEIKKAVTEERQNKVTESKSVLERANEALTKAVTALNTAKLKAQERLRKLTYEERELTKVGKDITEVRAKIAKVEDSVTRAAQRRINAEQRIADLQAALSEESEANKQAEEIYKELESGVQVTVTPQKGNRRAISLKTKKGGLDITKLFKKSKDVGAPLGALSKAVNDLAGVVKQSIGARATSNEALTALEKRIEANKKALDNAKASDTLSASERKRVDAARKRLEQLAKAKSEATLDSRVSPRTKKLYTELKEKQNTRPKSSNSEAVKAAAKKLNEAHAKQRRALKLLEKQKLAKQLAAEAAKVQGDKERKVAALEQLLREGKYAGTTKEQVELDLARAKEEANPSDKNRLNLLGLWVTNLVGNGILSALAIATGTVNFAARAALQAAPLSLIPLLKNLASAKWKYKLPLLSLLAGVASSEQFGRSLKAAKIAFLTGERVKRTLGTEKIQGNIGLAFTEKASDTNLLGVGEDALRYIRDLKYDGNIVGKLLVAGYKNLATPAGFFMRTLAASEAIVFGQAYNAYVDYENAVQRNKAVKEGRDPSKYDVKLGDNMVAAQAKAAAEAKAIRDLYKSAGIEGEGITAAQEQVRALEILQQMQPEETQIYAFKQASSLVLNGPAGGMFGMAAKLLNHASKLFEYKGIAPLQYFTAFSNSIAHVINETINYIPLLGLLDVAADLGKVKRANLTESETALRLSGAITSTTVGAALIMQAIANLDLPEEERPWDITSRFSSDPEKVQRHLDSGGLLRAVRIGNTWVPFNETGLGGWLSVIGEMVDKRRNAKDVDPVIAITALAACAEIAGGASGLKSIGSMSMTSGIVKFGEALSTLLSEESPSPEKKAAAVRAIYSPIRGLIPSASFYKYLARYTDNPVDTKRDINSVLVEGVPYFQSKFGKPALNSFGEQLPPSNMTTGLYRLFSNRTSDLEFTWLTNNGYQTPGINNLVLTKSDKTLTGMDKPDYEMKYAAMENAAPKIRETVRKYRVRYGSSANRDVVQKALTADVQAILARSLAPEVKKYLQAHK